MPHYELNSPDPLSCMVDTRSPSQLRHFSNTPYCSSSGVICNHYILLSLPTPLKIPSPPPLPIFEQIISSKVSYKIHTLLLEAEDSETESFLLAFHNQQLEDLKKVERKGRSKGSTLQITRSGYNRGVTETSRVDD